MATPTTASNRAGDIPAPLTRWKKFWLLVDVAAALTDQAFDMIMMHEYAKNDRWAYFSVGLSTVLAPIVLTKCTFCCGPVEGCIQDEDGDNFFVQFVPGVNMLVAAFYAAVLPRRRFKTKATRMEKVYKQTRAFEAFLEAGPQAIFQVMVALHQVEGIIIHILLTSLALSLFSLTKTLVAFFIFEDYIVYYSTYREGSSVHYGNYQQTLRNDFPDKGTKVRMFLLSLFYGLFEVIPVVLSISLLGYFCGWYSIAISFAIQYVLLFIYLRVRGFDYSNMSESDERKANWRYRLIPLLTSIVGGRALPFKLYLCVRMFILGCYAVAILLINWDSADLNELSEIIVWVAILATGFWALLMPTFVNSCYNLEISFYSWSEDRYVTERFTKCFYPLEIMPEATNYCCGVNKRALELTKEGTDTTVDAVSAVLEA